MDATDQRGARASVFDGLRVLDVTEGFAGALATMLLADNGAAVVRLVAPDAERHDPADAVAGVRQWHRSKDVRVVDPRVPAHADEVERLWRDADVVVVTDHAWVWQAARDAGRDLPLDGTHAVHCVIDGFGEHPTLHGLPAHSSLVHAAAGRMVDYGRTFALDRPVFVAPPLAGFGAGMAAVHGVCAALLERQRTGRGRVLRTSLLRALTAFDLFGPMGNRLLPSRPAGGDLGPYPALGYIPAPTKDGRWLQWANYAPHLLWQQLDVLGLGELKDDPRFETLPAVSPDAAHELWERVLEATRQRTADEWMAILRERGSAGGDVIVHTREGMDHPQARHNGDVIVVDGPDGRIEQIGPIARFSATPSRLAVSSWDEAAGWRAPHVDRASDDAPRPPLDGVVILEAATMIATPWSTAVLADLGARVIKIEPLGGEPGRALPFLKMLHGKESITVDIKSPAGREVVHELVRRADAFVHNYRPGVPEKLGIDAGTLRRVNPDLVYVYAGAYGSDGPYVRMPGYHPTAGAIAGNAALQAGETAFDLSTVEGRKAESLHRFRANEGHPDPVTGMVVAAALLMGLVARVRTGVAQDITCSMLGANAYLMSDDWIRYRGAPERPRLDAEMLGTGPLERLYRARDGWVLVCAPTQPEWQRLCAVLGAERLAADPRFATAEARRENAGA
ncbi:MAG TPA: CoA transferase, partial [Acidimicrobiales bacterium]